MNNSNNMNYINNNIYSTNYNNINNGSNNYKNKPSIFTNIIRIVLMLAIIFLIVVFFMGEGKDLIYELIGFDSIKVSTLSPNKYYRENNYDYVQITDDFIAKDKQHLLNIYYTITNSGADTFTFACSKSYESCLDDVDDISNNSIILSNIKSFLHPFNGFTQIETSYSNRGEVIINIYKTYSDEEIKILEKKISDIVALQKVNPKDIKAVIKTYHDYIINNTKYDSARIENQIINYKSEKAYGALIEGYALCEGYTDAMALFLDYYNIGNYKVISEAHVWNAIYYQSKWYHLDLTWDDPVTTSGRDVLRDTYFLITTDELLKIEKTDHNFDKAVFSEIK